METRLPVACTLPAGEGAGRRARWERLAARGEAELERTETGIRLALRRDPAIESELRELAQLERACCAFARWTVTADADRVVLDVAADGDGVHAVQAMFRA